MTAVTLLGRAKQTYASAAHGAGRVLTGVRLLPKEPPPRRHRLRHWAFSLTRVHDSLAIAALDVPWWTYRAIDAVEVWLAGREEPVRAFEYGSGASTLWLAARCGSVVSVEHHRGFAESMRPVLSAHDNIDFRLVEPMKSAAARVPSAKEGHGGLDFTEYVDTIHDPGGIFDLVVIDGRAREACFGAAVLHLAANGLIVFDNSRRARYRKTIEQSGLNERRFAGLTPTLPYPDQTSLLTP